MPSNRPAVPTAALNHHGRCYPGDLHICTSSVRIVRVSTTGHLWRHQGRQAAARQTVLCRPNANVAAKRIRWRHVLAPFLCHMFHASLQQGSIHVFKSASSHRCLKSLTLILPTWNRIDRSQICQFYPSYLSVWTPKVVASSCCCVDRHQSCVDKASLL